MSLFFKVREVVVVFMHIFYLPIHISPNFEISTNSFLFFFNFDNIFKVNIFIYFKIMAR